MPAAALEMHFLDVGPTQYGDCLVIRNGAKNILIDGAHQGDMQNRTGYPSIPAQLDTIFGTARPHQFDLLVVTHCHSDHIGCLPDLVAQGVIRSAKSYVADEALGWGEHGGDVLPPPVDSRFARILDVLREEDATRLSAAQLDQALADTASLRTRYHTMLGTLAQQGTVISCDGTEDRAAIEAEFAAIGLRILGPTKKHLQLCADQIAKGGRDALEALNAATNLDSSVSIPDAYRQIIDQNLGLDDFALLDQFGQGAALNTQSIVLALGFAGKKILLGGDMQFAVPEVKDLDAEMAKLRKVVKDQGPFNLIKTSHHTSYNGWDDSVGLEQLAPAGEAWLVHSGGLNDPSHPEPNVLRVLKRLKQGRADPLTYLRTDRNGRISFKIAANGKVTFTKAKGRINTFTPNIADLFSAPESTGQSLTTTESGAKTTVAVAGGFIEVTTRIPNTKTRVTVTIEVDPTGGGAGAGGGRNVQTESENDPPPGDPAPLNFKLAPGRALPALVFVTDEQALGRKIGAANARAAIAAIKAEGKTVINLRLANRSALEAAQEIQPRLAGADGVVLLGGLDVVPSLRLDVLGPELRPQLNDPEGDPDNFIVWNDEIYGDRDNDQLAEIPVSRIPDGGSAGLVASALGAGAHGQQRRFGLRNVRRPFAAKVFKPLPGGQPLLVSEPVRSSGVLPNSVQSDFAYFMLHGDDGDAQHFWGETAGGPLEAFSLDQVPPRFTGVVFAGCCWGALTTTRRALAFNPGDPVTCRTARDSIALRFVAAGAQAFVGCTGVHYSPGGNDTTSAGGPMHVKFFARLLGGDPPARALFRAKHDCLEALAPDASPEELAVSIKVIRQFTCLGLGW